MNPTELENALAQVAEDLTTATDAIRDGVARYGGALSGDPSSAADQPTPGNGVQSA